MIIHGNNYYGIKERIERFPHNALFDPASLFRSGGLKADYVPPKTGSPAEFQNIGARSASSQTGYTGSVFQQPATRPSAQILGASTSSGGGGMNQDAKNAAFRAQGLGDIAPVGWEPQPAAPSLDFAAINQAIGELDAFEGETRTLLGGGEQQAEAFKSAAVSRAGQSKEQGLGAVEQRKTETKQAGSQAETEQRRGFSEIAQQFLGRFGRTGFGQGVTGALGEATLQNVGKIRAGVESTMQKLFQSAQEITSQFDTAVEEANYQAETIKTNSKAQLQQALAQIGAQRGALQSQKSELVNRALENYRQQIIDVNSRNTAFQQQIQLARFNADEAIRAAQAKAANTLQNLSSFSFTPGETKVVPLSDFGGAEQAGAFAGTQLPAGGTFTQSGQYGIFNVPSQKEQDPYTQFLQSQGVNVGQ